MREKEIMTREKILDIFKQTGALLEGHFQLTSGLHSSSYFQCAKVLQYPEHTHDLCEGIGAHFRGGSARAVVSPALGGIVVGQEVGRQLNVRSMFTERKENGMHLRRGFAIAPGEKILVCEDVVTTGGSVGEVVEIVRRLGGEVVGVAAIVDRSGGKITLPNFFATLTMDVVTYLPDKCPLCQKGLPVEKPGSRPVL
jgi:orotate phosphoribosyltransferase